MTRMFRGPFARWAWSMAFGYEDEPVYVGLSSAWIYEGLMSSPEIRFRGNLKERNHFFNILWNEQLRQDGES